MKGTFSTSSGLRDRSLAAMSLAAALAVAGCGSGDDSTAPDGSATPTDDTTLPTVTVPEGGFAPTIGEGTDFYPAYSFSLPLLAKGFADVGGYRQEYPIGVTNDLKGCTIGNLGALDTFEPSTDRAVIANSIAALATVAGAFATTADLSAGDNFSFWRLGDAGTENWSAYFSGPAERWSGSGQEALVQARFVPYIWINDSGQKRSFPVLAIEVRWTGEATENLSSRTSSAIVEFECFFAPTGDLLIEYGAIPDPNDNGILDADEIEQLRQDAYEQAVAD